MTPGMHLLNMAMQSRHSLCSTWSWVMIQCIRPLWSQSWVWIRCICHWFPWQQVCWVWLRRLGLRVGISRRSHASIPLCGCRGMIRQFRGCAMHCWLIRFRFWLSRLQIHLLLVRRSGLWRSQLLVPELQLPLLLWQLRPQPLLRFLLGPFKSAMDPNLSWRLFRFCRMEFRIYVSVWLRCRYFDYSCKFQSRISSIS